MVFKDDGQPKTALQLFKDHGYNWIRLRLFHTPTRLPNDFPYTLALAKDAKKMGYKSLLNFHYSDIWADPEKQFIPEAWTGKSHVELIEAVQNYTRDTVAAFREVGAKPDMVQIGNEVNCLPIAERHTQFGLGRVLAAWLRGKLLPALGNR